LCLAAHAAGAQERAIRATVVIPASVGEVWTAWTTTEGIKTFFAPDAKIEARVDGAFEVYMNPFAEPGSKGSDGMRVLAIQEKKMITFTWNAPPSLPEIRKQRTYVTLRFKPLAERSTEVILLHGGWGEGEEWDRAFQYFEKAWTAVLANLEARFARGPINWTEWLKKMRENSRVK
jgi:uncharacterized protein YndB with AHSA1/START domain